MVRFGLAGVSFDSLCRESSAPSVIYRENAFPFLRNSDFTAHIVLESMRQGLAVVHRTRLAWTPSQRPAACAPSSAWPLQQRLLASIEMEAVAGTRTQRRKATEGLWSWPTRSTPPSVCPALHEARTSIASTRPLLAGICVQR